MEAPTRRGGEAMLIAGCFVVGAAFAGWFLGWRTGVEVLGAYGFCLVGANSPQHFINSKHWLERVANRIKDKAVGLASKGKR